MKNTTLSPIDLREQLLGLQVAKEELERRTRSFLDSTAIVVDELEKTAEAQQVALVAQDAEIAQLRRLLAMAYHEMDRIDRAPSHAIELSYVYDFQELVVDYFGEIPDVPTPEEQNHVKRLA